MKFRIINKISRSFIFLVNLGFIVLLLLAYLSSVISPVHINFISFISFAFPLIWIINVIFAVIWLINKRKRGLISLALVIITSNLWFSVFQFEGKHKEISTFNKPLTVMSYNVRMFDRYLWTKDKTTPDKIYDFIRKENPDVLCIQEFFINNKNSQHSENKILAKFKQYRYKHIEYNIETKSGQKFGLATFSKFPIINKKPLYFTNNTTNFCIQSDIDVNGTKLRVFNNHLESIRLKTENYNFIDSLEYKNEKERKKGILDIFHKLSTAFSHRSIQAETIGKHIQNSPYPAIVCGDFNDTPVSYVYKTVRGDLKDSFIESGSGFSGTYNGDKLPSFRIDFIFLDKGFTSYNHERIKVSYSDHFPIKSTIELQPDK